MANEKRLIDAVALAEEIYQLHYCVYGIRSGKTLLIEYAEKFREDVLRAICKAPTVDAVPVVHGYDTGHCRIFKCSICGYGVDDIFQEDERNYPVGEFNYCPNCGATMDGDGDA